MTMINMDAQRWLRQAQEDMATAIVLFEAERYAPCAFFCQQAVEKGLKAVLYSAGERPWGHSIPSLLDQVCAVLGIEAEDAPVGEVEALDEHYMRPRYPDAQPEQLPEYDLSAAELALEQARTVLTFAERGCNARTVPDDAAVSDMG